MASWPFFFSLSFLCLHTSLITSNYFGYMYTRRKWQPTTIFLLLKTHRQRSLTGYSSWGHKESDTGWATKQCVCVCVCVCTGHKESTCQCRTQKEQVWSLDWEYPLEKEMSIHSSIFAWKIPWTEEPGRLLFMRLHRVVHNWVIKSAHMYVYIYACVCIYGYAWLIKYKFMCNLLTNDFRS